MARRKRADNLVRLNAGIIAAAVYNAAPFGGENRKVMDPLDFVPEWKHVVEAQEHDLTKMSPERQRDYLFSIFGKRVMRK